MKFIIKKLLILLLVMCILAAVACSKNDYETNPLDKNYSSQSEKVNDNKIDSSSSSENQGIDVSSLLSSEEYQEFVKEQFNVSNWDYYTELNGDEVYHYGDINLSGGNCYLTISDGCRFDANGWALGKDTPAIIFQAQYLDAQKDEFYIGCYSDISLEHSANFVLKIFEKSSAKITVEDFLKNINNGEKIDGDKEYTQTISIKGIEYRIEIMPVFTLVGEYLYTEYHIDAKLAK